MTEKDWNSYYKQELERALRARQDGNEGMARVCARRAAGWLLGEYFRRQEIHTSATSALGRLKKFIDLPSTSEELREIAGHFLLRITTNHELPVEADLITELQRMRSALIDDET